MKINRHGKAAVINQQEYAKIRKQLVTDKYKLLWDIAWFTGERWGAIVQLEIADVFEEKGSPREFINFKARTRKASPDGSRETRQVPTHETLKYVLKNYKFPKGSKFLFPSRNSSNKAMGTRYATRVLKKAVEKAGLTAKGISSHTTRRSLITHLWENGTDLFTIKQITGHKSYQVLEEYIQSNNERIKKAINIL